MNEYEVSQREKRKGRFESNKVIDKDNSDLYKFDTNTNIVFDSNPSQKIIKNFEEQNTTSNIIVVKATCIILGYVYKSRKELYSYNYYTRSQPGKTRKRA